MNRRVLKMVKAQVVRSYRGYPRKEWRYPLYLMRTEVLETTVHEAREEKLPFAISLNAVVVPEIYSEYPISITATLQYNQGRSGHQLLKRLAVNSNDTKEESRSARRPTSIDFQSFRGRSNTLDKVTPLPCDSILDGLTLSAG
nr:hypothetical transcript [Hymenolepis microstoma]